MNRIINHVCRSFAGILFFLLVTAFLSARVSAQAWLPGDTNQDHDVDIYDYYEVFSHFGERGYPGFTNADLTGDTIIDIMDLNILMTQYGQAETSAYCSPGSPVSCNTLGSSWSSGVAVCRADGMGYAVNDCVRSPLHTSEVVKPLERSTRWLDARCNDGTAFGFEVELSPAGESSDWIVYLQGGGFCDDQAFLCSEREPHLKTGMAEQDRAFISPKNQGIFNADPSQNATFWSANKVFAHYCSSDAWSGSTAVRRPTTGSTAGWYFSGRRNVRALLETLQERYGLADDLGSSRILFAGGSGGGHGVGITIDMISDIFPRLSSSGAVKVVNDAGLQMDFDNPSFRPGNSLVPIRDIWQNAYSFWGADGNSLCEASRIPAGLSPSFCSFAPLAYTYVADTFPNGHGLPTLIQESSLDSAFLRWHNIDPYDPVNASVIEEFRTLSLNSLSDAQWLFSGGAFPYHTILEKDSIEDGWNMGPSGSTFRELLTRFWEGGPPERVVWGNPNW